jgi:hypothetical protein
MASNLKTLDSVGGFSVDNTDIITDTKDIKNVNSLEIKNSAHNDSFTSHYILRGINTSVLSLNEQGDQIFLPSNTINFITGHIIGVNDNGGGHYSLKIESCVTVGSAGNVQELSSLTTIIKDSVPSGQTWSAVPFVTGSANRYSYSVTRAGTTSQIKWVAYVQVISIDWT